MISVSGCVLCELVSSLLLHGGRDGDSISCSQSRDLRYGDAMSRIHLCSVRDVCYMFCYGRSWGSVARLGLASDCWDLLGLKCVDSVFKR